ncbi:hypothetical protein [Halopelagius longus]|uniref:DUF4239 domain-containing protein n=1 Tax=Halopelagius longus TaxID=1236180 RepID=A0A1H1G9U6_9EURY|nr:hypothetical protein [Halopelagius longus]RDI69753.1 hypothetical protein DWB78_16500 [Halopelagius longus]SDR10014.1 hypothetical protein SAMN05216278_3619 [Halopelagius longus]
MADARRRIVEWTLIGGNRHVVASLLLAVAFLTLLSLGHLGVVTLEDQATVRSVVGGFVPGLIAFLSIVLGINQLVLSQELASPGEIRRRIEDVREYRHDVEEAAGAEPSPVLPTGFLAFVVRAIESEAETLAENARPETDSEVRDAVEEYAANVLDESRRAQESLEQAHLGRINALLPVLEYDDSYQLIEARRLREEYEDELSEESLDALSHMIQTLELFSVARSQFRSTYTQRVLAHLSRRLLYVGLPALLVVVVLGLLRTPSAVGTGWVRLVVVSALFTVAFSPLAVLSAYLFRVASVAERTISEGPFVSRPQEAREGWNRESRARHADRTGSSDGE